MEKIKAYIAIARPPQYLKNLFVWLPLFFGYKISDFQAISNTFFAFVAFCMAASSIYVLNDLMDIQEDQQHPVKKFRPLASGKLGRNEALVFLAVLLGGSMTLSILFLPVTGLTILGIYLVLNASYSLKLKHMAIIDVTCISIGFVLRVFEGGVAAGVSISHWLIVMTFLLALFLALAKRRDDLYLAREGKNVRKSIDGYNLEFVSHGMIVMASVIIVSYILYTVSPEITQKHHTQYLYLTSIWVILGLLRYMQITIVLQKSGSPTQVLIKDIPLQFIIFSWLISFYVIIYGLKSFGKV